MPGRLTVLPVPHTPALAHVADLVTKQAQARGQRVARICPTSAAATRTLQRLADAGQSPLGVETTTLAAWARNRWTLYGDGRACASGAQRRAAVLEALAATPATALRTDTPGMAVCVERALRAGTGTPAFEGDSGAMDSLSPAERDLYRVCRTYQELLASHGLIEPASVLSCLARALPPAGWMHLVVEDPTQLTDAELQLLAQAALHEGVTVVACLGQNPAFEATHLVVDRLVELCREQGAPVVRDELPGGAPVGAPWRSPEIADLATRLFTTSAKPVVPRGDVRFCLPSGRYAEPELLTRTLRSLVSEGFSAREIAVACANPLRLAEGVASRLAETPGRGIACRAEGTVPLAATNIARLLDALMALQEAAQENAGAPSPDLRPVASDAARNPLAGIAVADALELDCAWRGDRSMSAQGFLDGMVGVTARCEEGTDELGASRLEEALEALGRNDVTEAATILVETADTTDVLAKRERTAAARIGALAQAHAQLSPGTPLTRDALQRLIHGTTIPVAWTSVPASDIAAQRQAAVLEANPNAIEFCTPAQLAGRSFEAVVLCDLTADATSVADRSSASSLFLEHLGVWSGANALQAARFRLRSVLESARSRVVFERCLQDPEAKNLRPSALFEEIVDCYRLDPCATDDLNRITGLPQSGALPLVTLGEEHFAELASPSTWTPAPVPVAPPAVFLPSAVARKQLVREDHLWSPAALELYLSCPLRWFYERQLPSQGIDASFGPRELGAFSRRVLKAFHETVAAHGTPRIAGKEDRASWEPLLDACFAQVLADQDDKDNPLVPVTHLERERLETVRRDLRGCVERDALLPAGFIPRHHEWGFGDREVVPYGSVRLRGTVDRIDEDGKGHALVIDYKGAFGDDYGVPRAKRNQDPLEVDRLPVHSQALMYATALQRMRPGTTAVGALYVSYNRARVMGFLDGSVHGLVPSESSYLNEKSLVESTDGGGSGFQELLNYLEGEVALAMDRLRDGDVSARPRFGKRSCAYCTVTGCPKRRTA